MKNGFLIDSRLILPIVAASARPSRVCTYLLFTPPIPVAHCSSLRLILCLSPPHPAALIRLLISIHPHIRARICTLKLMHHRFTCGSFFVPNVCSLVYTLSCCTYVWTSAYVLLLFSCNKFPCSATKHKRLIYYRCIADMVLSVYRRWAAERFVSAVSICAECRCSCACASENR